MGPSPELTALTAQLWNSTEDGPVKTEWARRGAPNPIGWTLAERYAVVPSVGRPRFLVPLLSRRAAAASLLRYNALRSPRTALVRGALGTMYRLGAGRIFGDELRVYVSADRNPAEWPDLLLTARLAQELGLPVVAAGIGVRPIDPNSKPTLQLFDAEGAPVGYAKIGWNDATRALVITEAATLADLPSATDHASAPALVTAGEWSGREYAVTAPLPPDVTRHREVDVPPPPAALGSLLGSGAPDRLAGSAYWQVTTEALAAMRGAGDAPELAAALTDFADALVGRWGSAELIFARWHGDWVPWNIGWSKGQLQIWDWEHSGPAAPAGFDLAHWHFQVAFVLRRQGLAAGWKAVRGATADPDLRTNADSYDGPAIPGPVGHLYLLEMALRTYRLFTGGGGWNSGLYPAILPLLTTEAQALRSRGTDPVHRLVHRLADPGVADPGPESA